LFIPSCDEVTENTIYDSSKDAQIYSFSVTASFYKNSDSTEAAITERALDSLTSMNLSYARFVINQIDGVIYNVDSLPYGITPKKVKMSVTFNTTSSISRFEIHVPDSASYYEWNQTDSVDFSKMPIFFRVTAPYGNIKDYRLDLRIHQTDPDTIAWQQLSDFEAADGEQKVLLHNNTFYAYSSDGSSVLLYTADKANPAIWTPHYLSSPVLLESITVMNDMFFAVSQTGDSYTSADGIAWTKQNNGKTVQAIYGVIPGATPQDDVLLLAVQEADGKLYFGTTADLTSIDIIDKVSEFPNDPSIPAGFPVKGFTSATNSERNRYKLLIVTAGADANNNDLSTTWLVKKTADGLELTASSYRDSGFKGAGLSAFLYDNSLYVFAPLEKDGASAVNALYISKSWGDTWTAAPAKQQLPESMEKRAYPSIVVDNENYIWIFGGISETGTPLKDLWKGRLNRLAGN
jgi:hypothetical protein